MKFKLTHLLFMAVAVMFLFTGCADASHVQECLPPTEHTYGFWGGVWHGMITWFSFIGSLFSDNIAVYAVNNNGAWYDFGFVGGLGVMLRFIGGLIKGILS